MAKDDTQSGAPQARVYKTNTVHKRRAGRTLSSREEKIVPGAVSDGAVDERAATRGLGAESAAESANRLDPEASSPSGHKPKEGRDVQGHGKGPAGSENTPASDLEGNVAASGSAADGAAGEGWVDGSAANGGAAGDSATGSAASGDGEASGDQGEGSSLAQDDDDAEEGGAPSKRVRPKTDPRTLAKRIAIAVVAVLVILAVGFCSYIAWNRWGRFDDAADIQGQWYVDGTATPIVIDGETIQLSDNVAYSYEIDTQEKTIRFSFANWEGQGRYRFSDDRQRLLIIDGQYGSMGNLFDDLLTSFDDMAKSGAGTVAEPSGGGLASSESAPSSASVEDSGTAQETGGQEAASTESAPQPESQTAAESGASQQSSEQEVSANAADQQTSASTSLGQGVALFNRQADPEALKAKEAAEKAAREQAEREAKEAAEAEAEEADYYYYDDSYEYVEEGDESQEDVEYASDEDEETWADEEY